MDDTHPDPDAGLLDLAELDAGWDPAETTPVPRSSARATSRASESSVVRRVDFGSRVGRSRSGFQVTQGQLSLVAVPLLILLGGAWALRSSGKATDRVDLPLESAVADALEPERVAPSAAPAPPAAPMQHVRVAVEPSAAEIFDGEMLLGAGDVDVALEPNTQKTLRASLPGYQSRMVSVDESTPLLLIQLEKLPTPRARALGAVKRPGASPAVAPQPLPSSEAGSVYPEP